jgi:Tfp pilus assembly protein FimV
MPEQWLDYRELAAHWQIGPDAARARVRRGNFKRRTNNFGEVEVLMDMDAPIPRPRKAQDGQTRTATPPNTPNAETASAATAKALEALEGHVATLKEQLAKAETATATERERVADLTAQLMRLTTELLDARKAPPPPRSWWQRLVG